MNRYDPDTRFRIIDKRAPEVRERRTRHGDDEQGVRRIAGMSREEAMATLERLTADKTDLEQSISSRRRELDAMLSDWEALRQEIRAISRHLRATE